MTNTTTLIIGAGASKSYGFPLGRQLIRDVLALLPTDPRAPRMSGAAERIAESLQVLQHKGQLDRTSASEAYLLSGFRTLLAGQQPNSIDAFLARDFEDRTSAYRWIGKLAIAHVIGACESWTNLDGPQKSGGDAPADHWYDHFWSVLNIAKADDFHDLPLKIISFNYDRSFDQFLAERLTAVGPDRSRIGYVRDDTWWKPGVERLSVLHPYGTPGGLHELPFGALSGKTSFAEQLIAAAGRISVIGEERDLAQPDAFQQAQSWIADSDRIVFLGFGFDPMNMKRLGIDNSLARVNKKANSISSRTLFATTYGLERFERTSLYERFFGSLLRPDSAQGWGGPDCPIQHDHYSVGITTYLRRFGALSFG